jgi:putative membrane protein
MKGFLIKWLANIIALMAVVCIIPGIKVDTWQTLTIAALMLGLVNAFLRPLIILFTLPLHILSLGFFTLIVNGLLFYGVSKAIKGFGVSDLASAFWGALFFSIISFVLSLFISPQGKLELRFRHDASWRKPKYKNVIDVEGKTEK